MVVPTLQIKSLIITIPDKPYRHRSNTFGIDQIKIGLKRPMFFGICRGA